MTGTGTNDATARTRLDEAIDTIEGGYEFLLAYAAQGRRTDVGAKTDQDPRRRLQAMAEALSAIGGLARDVASEARGGAGDADQRSAGDVSAFFDALDRDASVSLAAIRLVLGAKDVSSQLVDNLNASIHLRALLADLFLLDEALKG